MLWQLAVSRVGLYYFLLLKEEDCISISGPVLFNFVFCGHICLKHSNPVFTWPFYSVSTIFVRYTVVENSNYFYSSDRIKMIRYTQVLYSFSYQIFLLRYFHLNIPDIYIFRSSGHLSDQNNIRDTFMLIYCIRDIFLFDLLKTLFGRIFQFSVC